MSVDDRVAGQLPSRPAGWYRDVTGRFAGRWYDGTEWTNRVMASATAMPTVDPLPPPVRGGDPRPEPVRSVPAPSALDVSGTEPRSWAVPTDDPAEPEEPVALDGRDVVSPIAYGSPVDETTAPETTVDEPANDVADDPTPLPSPITATPPSTPPPDELPAWAVPSKRLSRVATVIGVAGVCIPIVLVIAAGLGLTERLDEQSPTVTSTTAAPASELPGGESAGFADDTPTTEAAPPTPPETGARTITVATDPPRVVQRDPNKPFANCDEVRAAGRAPLLQDTPGWNPRLDPDGDGIACDR